MFRFYNRLSLSPPLINNMFKLKAENSYNLRQVSEFSRPMVKSVYQRQVKNIDNLEHFKKEIKTWTPDNCACRLCKVYIESVGFL